MTELTSPTAQNFSLTNGGPLHRLLVRLGQKRTDRDRVVRRAVLVTVLTWLPLLALSLGQGVALGPRVALPFLHDFAVNLRFLVAVPILILAESKIDRRWRQLVREFVRCRLVGAGHLPAFEAAIDRITRLRDRMLPEAVLALAALLPSFFSDTAEVLTVSSWHHLSAGNPEFSLAGWWFNIVSAPIFRFLFLRWAWMEALWAIFLWRASRLELRLVATHSDLAAGLGFLSEGQRAFAPIVFAGGTVIAGKIGNALVFEGATLASMQYHMIAYGVLAVLLLVAPLLVVSPILIGVRKKALLEYGALVTDHDQQFDAKWVRGACPAGETILGNPDASSLADLGASFAVVRDMGVVPIDRRTLLALAVAAALPMLPIVVFATPADELIRAVLKMLR